jgi:hypothetical protein
MDWMEKNDLSIELWSAISNSCEVGAKKPDPLIFLDCLKKLGIEPHQGYVEIFHKIFISFRIFVGHEQMEIDGTNLLFVSFFNQHSLAANSVGLTPILYNGFSSLAVPH